MKMRASLITCVAFVALAGPAGCNEIVGIEPPISILEACDGKAEGETVACYTGPEVTLGVGECHGGLQACDGKGETTGECMGEVLPAKEICGDDDDDDCNGLVDDDCTVCGDGIVSGGEECDGAELCTDECVFLRVERLSLGREHTCAILNDGRLKCWGRNDRGQLGLGDSEHRGNEPGEMGELLPAVDLGENGARVIDVAAGYDHTCALLESGTVKCWGNNDRGQLGLDMPGAELGDAPGEMGDNLPPVPLGLDAKAVTVVAGAYHTCALLADGIMKCWGWNNGGQLGLATNQGNFSTPQQVVLAAKPVAIGAGYAHTCIVLEGGSLKCFGESDAGQLGLGNKTDWGDAASETVDSQLFVDVGMQVVTQLALGGYESCSTSGCSYPGHTCALASDGSVRCWGQNNDGQLGLVGLGVPKGQNWGDDAGETMMQAIPGLSATAITAGISHTCALSSAQSVLCWGRNGEGRLGLSDDLVQQGQVETPSPVALGPDPVIFIATGGQHNCALFGDGKLKCWGANNAGQLGLGDNQHRGDNPGEMAALPEVKVF